VAWYDILLVIFLVFSSVIEWDMIGKPRKPKTTSDALVGITINLLLIAWLCWH